MWSGCPSRLSPCEHRCSFPLWRDASELYEEFHKGWEGDDPLRDAFHDALQSDRGFPSGEAAEAITAWIERHRKALRLVEEGIVRGRCQFPEPKGPGDLLPWLAPLRGFAWMRVLKAKKLTGAGDFRAASREVKRVFRMGEMIQDGEGSLIHWLVGIAIQGIGMGGIRWLAANESVPAGVLVELTDRLRPPASPGAGLACSFRLELPRSLVPCTRQVLKDLNSPEREREVDSLITLTLLDEEEGFNGILALLEEFKEFASKGPKPVASKLSEALLAGGDELVDVDDTFLTAGAFYARIIRNAGSSWKKRDRRIDRDIEEYCTALKKDLAKAVEIAEAAVREERNLTDMEATAIRRALPNPVGRTLVTLIMPALGAASERAFRTRADRAATRAILALRLREVRKGVLPDSLRALADERILDSVPVDPFSDGPLRYSRERRLIWSVGSDETDDGGRDRPGTWTGKDYVRRVPGGR